MLSVRVRPAEQQAAQEARYLDLEMTRDDMTRDVPALHARRALVPRTCDHLTVARKIVLAAKVTSNAPSVPCDKRRAPRLTACPQTLERGRVQ